ncbi:hypothetical protein K9L63_01320 [Candidatus Gracilibacteria bacterium]|nr:hypothetical protein [Candidatus Gracilibacteria bacterium]
MKKTSFLSLILALPFGVVSNVVAYQETLKTVPGTVQHEISNQAKLNEAIQRRWSLFQRKHVERNTVEKTIPYRDAIHDLSLQENNVPRNPNIMERSGALRTIPEYDDRRPTSNPSTSVPANATSVLRNRLIDYYVEGGDAGTEMLRNRGIKSSQYVVPVPTAPRWATADPETLSTVRAVQRALYTPPSVGAGQQLMRTARKGDYYRNFWSPYMPMDEEIEEQNGGFFSTEAE